MQYESAGKRRDGSISREGSVALRRALIDLGMGLWLTERQPSLYAKALRERGKRGGVIACALATALPVSPTPWSATTPFTTAPLDPDHRPRESDREGND